MNNITFGKEESASIALNEQGLTDFQVLNSIINFETPS